MPTSYAHYKFGQRVVDLLPEKYHYFAYEYPEYFYPALHGPDVTFYLLTSPRVIEVGNELHLWSGKKYFEFAANPILAEMENGGEVRKSPQKALQDVLCPKVVSVLEKPFRKGVQPQSVILGTRSNDAYGLWTNRTSEKKLAYLFGFLCHYALDRTGHKFVNEMVDRGVAGHFEIEAEFDRLLMAMDGYDPLKHHVTDHIHPSIEMAENVKQFFPGFSTMDMYGALVGQKNLLKLFNLPGRLPGVLYHSLTKAAGIPKYGELLMPEKPDPKCYGTNKVLLEIFEATIPECVEFITELLDMVTGDKEWDERFQWNFDGEFVGWE